MFNLMSHSFFILILYAINLGLILVIAWLIYCLSIEKKIKRFLIELNSADSPKSIVRASNKFYADRFGIKWVFYHSIRKNKNYFGPAQDIQAINLLHGKLLTKEINNFALRLNHPGKYEKRVWVVPLKGRRGYFCMEFNFLGWISFNKKRDLSRVSEIISSAYSNLKRFGADNPHLREIMQSRLDFLHQTSHQLRTPLMALLGAVELLLQEKMNREETQEILRIAQERITSLNKLIEDILALKRSEKPRQPML